jgi:hypothetical protein
MEDERVISKLVNKAEYASILLLLYLKRILMYDRMIKLINIDIALWILLLEVYRKHKQNMRMFILQDNKLL